MIHHTLDVAGKKPNVWYLLILGVAGAGLAMDTFVIRAKAGTTTGTHIVDAGSASEGTATTTGPKRAEPLGGRFEVAQALLEPPAFRRLDGFAKPSDEIIAGPSENGSPASGFAARHKLTAVLSQPSGDLAVVDGLLLRIGDTVESLRLSVIEKDAVVFDGEGKSVRLPLARPGFDR